MNVSPVTNAPAPQNAPNMPQTVDYQSFLRLLVAQMKNQDPTSPMESTDYVAQLATFSQVEQSVQINNRLEAMMQAASLSQATGLIGRYVETMDKEMAGIIKQVEIYSDGVMLMLENGDKVLMGAGVVIRDADFTPPGDDDPPEDDTPPGGETPPDEDEA